MFSLLAELPCNQNGMIWLQVECGSIIKGDHTQIPFKLAANLWKALKSEISYDCVVIEGYRRVSSSYFSYFLSIFLFSSIFKLKPPIF